MKVTDSLETITQQIETLTLEQLESIKDVVNNLIKITKSVIYIDDNNKTLVKNTDLCKPYVNQAWKELLKVPTTDTSKTKMEKYSKIDTTRTSDQLHIRQEWEKYLKNNRYTDNIRPYNSRMYYSINNKFKIEK